MEAERRARVGVRQGAGEEERRRGREERRRTRTGVRQRGGEVGRNTGM
mgnify:CR=1 FL=1